MTMNFLSSIGGRLYALACVLALALGGVVWFAAVELDKVSDSALRTEQVRMPQLERMADLELNVTRVSLQLRHAILSRTPQERTATLDNLGELRRRMDNLVVDFEKNLSTEGGRQRFPKITSAMAVFWRAGEVNLQMITQERKEEAFAYLVDTTIPARNALLAAVKDTVDYQEQSLRDDLVSIRTEAGRILTVLVGLGVATMVGLLLFAWYMARTLHRRVALSRSVAERVRDGHLGQGAHDSGHDEFTPLLAAMADMRGALGRVVSDVRGIAVSVESASAEIAQGNSDLSTRTEQQASTLQNTASAMEQLSARVRQNAESAQRADQLAQGARTVASEGGNVVAEVVKTMRGITESSQQIGDIVGVIDSIAFQTNILALNAAVEAARAGEQGRGFAVVASEVRSLASRSATAAKEIKALIGASVVRVEQGTVLVDRAGATMQEIVAAIQRVTDLMGEISGASSEQSDGVAQIGDAVTRMDQATQQNAALVEQSAAAAASLNAQAQNLVRAVSVFTLDGAGGPRLLAAR
jgi:methyl-accepting chemotaxis protein